MMTYKEAIQLHYEKCWNNKGRARYWYKGPIDKLYPDFCVLEFKPSKDRNMWTYATCCMSSKSDNSPIELHMFSSSQDEGLVELLTTVAYYNKNNSSLGLNHTVNFGQPWQDSSKCEYGFISLPYLDGPNLENGKIKGYKHTVKFYWLVPVTETEVDFKSKYGVGELESKFESTAFNYLDANRLSVV